MTLRPLTLIGIMISIVTGICLGVLAHLWTRDHVQVQAAQTLTEALRQINSNYVEEISEEELLGHAIKGMIEGLDPHSDYLDTAAWHSLQAHTTGRFGGIGIEIGLVDGYFTVVAPMDDTPAARAGVQAGDRITSVDGIPAKGMKLADLVERMRGHPGSPVSLGIYRAEQDQSLVIDLQRAVIEIVSVRSRMLEPGYGYVRISQFQNTTSGDLAHAISRLREEAGTALSGLVIDLRNNPGGTLNASVEVADQFLDDGLIVYTEGRQQSSYARYQATHGDLLQGAPVVVLINSGSASASEIVAGALQDHGRARVMGTTSYGKGSVQSVLPLANNQGLKLTTAYYFTPSGRSIHETGIEPDIPVDGSVGDDTMLQQALFELKNGASPPMQARLSAD